MAILYRDRTQQITNTIGTGDLNLTQTIQSFATFDQSHNPGDEFYYCIEDGNNYEIGLGLLVDAITIQRTTILETLENGVLVLSGSALSLNTGAAKVFTVVSGKQLTDPEFENGIKTNTITEFTVDAGVTADGVLLKDSEVTTDIINEKTTDAGVTVDMVLLKDGSVTADINTDTINEKTLDAGVIVDGVLLKDSEVTTDVINEKTAAAGVTVDGALLKDGSINAITTPSVLSTLNLTSLLQIEGKNAIDQQNVDELFVGAGSFSMISLRQNTEVIGTLDVDVINERLAGSGVTADGVLLKDGEVNTGGGAKWTSGTGTPEAAVTGNVSDLFSRTDGGASTSLYVKESGTGNTGWVAK